MTNWHINTWPKYLAWNSNHKKTLEKILTRDVDISTLCSLQKERIGKHSEKERIGNIRVEVIVKIVL